MTTSWLHALHGTIHKAETKVSWGKKNQQKNIHTQKKVCENKETDSPSGTCIYRMKLPWTCSLLKESHEKEKWDSCFWGVGLKPFLLGLLLFIKEESRTPTFKILVRTLFSAKSNVCFYVQCIDLPNFKIEILMSH